MKVYILAPANRTSGGPELAHQLCFAINRLTDIRAEMCYVDVKAPFDKALAVDAEAPEPYKIYKTTHVTDVNVMCQEDAVVVFPEGLTLSMPYVEKAKKVLWWMSVDNYIKSTEETNLSYINDNVCFHLYQSYYSIDYVNKKLDAPRGMYLSDYINDAHGKFIYPAQLREDIALYNPAKGYEEIKPLIEKASWLKWIPLVNLDLEHMILMMEAGKIYVDFGNHPGKDRIPREAAANGCCVITNKKGSAAFVKDVPIPDEYKFDCPAEQLDQIDALLKDICGDFEKHQNKFQNYRQIIASEKKSFEEDTIKFVDTMQKLIP